MRLIAERVIVEQYNPQKASTGSEEEIDDISEEIICQFSDLVLTKPYDVMRFLSPRETVVLKSMKTCSTYNFAGYGETLFGYGKIWDKTRFTRILEIDVPRFEFDAEYLEDKLQQKLLQKYIKIKNG